MTLIGHFESNCSMTLLLMVLQWHSRKKEVTWIKENLHRQTVSDFDVSWEVVFFFFIVLPRRTDEPFPLSESERFGASSLRMALGSGVGSGCGGGVLPIPATNRLFSESTCSVCSLATMWSSPNSSPRPKRFSFLQFLCSAAKDMAEVFARHSQPRMNK